MWILLSQALAVTWIKYRNKTFKFLFDIFQSVPFQYRNMICVPLLKLSAQWLIVQCPWLISITWYSLHWTLNIFVKHSPLALRCMQNLNMKSALFDFQIFDAFNFERQISLLRNEILMGLWSRRIISRTNLSFIQVGLNSGYFNCTRFSWNHCEVELQRLTNVK